MTAETHTARPRIASHTEWLAARKALLAREKELTQIRDAVVRQRRELPWVRIDKTYSFDTPKGRQALAELFEGRSQLVVQHFMFGPGWTEGCVGCSFEADHVDGARQHLEQHDVSFVAVSRAPLPDIEAYRRRMGWGFRWVSSHGSDFNFDFQVSFTPAQIASGKAEYNFETIDNTMDELSGVSVFAMDETGALFRTYSSYGRGCEELIGAYMYLDITPKGRNENGPNFNLTDWVRRHDEYATAGGAKACCG